MTGAHADGAGILRASRTGHYLRETDSIGASDSKPLLNRSHLTLRSGASIVVAFGVHTLIRVLGQTQLMASLVPESALFVGQPHSSLLLQALHQFPPWVRLPLLPGGRSSEHCTLRGQALPAPQGLASQGLCRLDQLVDVCDLTIWSMLLWVDILSLTIW